MDEIDKIVLSQDRLRCTVHLVNGTSLYFNFLELQMNIDDGLQWIQKVLNGPQEFNCAA